MFKRIVGANLLLLLSSLGLLAAPPVVNTLTPRGLQPGKEVTLTLTGTGLTPETRLVLPFEANQILLAEAKPNPTQVRLNITIQPTTPLGIYPVFALNDEGLSGVNLLAVDDLPAIAEKESNNSLAEAQMVPVPCVIDGQCAGGDLDFYRFPVRQGQRLTIEVQSARLGSGVLPLLRVTDEKNRLVASDDRQALQGDGRVSLTATMDGELFIEISDTRYRGANPPHYRLRIGEFDAIDEVFPLGSRPGEGSFTLFGPGLPPSTLLKQLVREGPFSGLASLPVAPPARSGTFPVWLALGNLPEKTWAKKEGEPRTLEVVAPVTVNARIERSGDVDRVQWSVKPNERYRVSVQAELLGSRLDGVLRIMDPSGKILSTADDTDLPSPATGFGPGRTVDPLLEITVPAEVSRLTAELRDQHGRGGIGFGYRLKIESSIPDFLLSLSSASLNVPRGGTSVLAVPIVRRGYTGPIKLRLTGLPSGMSFQGGEVPANGTSGVLTVTAAPEAILSGFAGFIGIEGTSTEGTPSLTRRAEMGIVLGRDTNVAQAVLPCNRLALGLGLAEPFQVLTAKASEPKPILVKGYPTTLAIQLIRRTNATNFPIQVTGLDPRGLVVPGQAAPAGFTFSPAVTAMGSEATIAVTAGTAAPEGTTTLLVQGKAKVGDKDYTVTGQALSVQVVPPFTVEMLDREAKLVPGGIVVVHARLQRQSVFKEAVTLKLDGLPMGVVLDKPLSPVPGDQRDFEIRLKVPAKIPPESKPMTLTAATTIGGAAYTLPGVSISIISTK